MARWTTATIDLLPAANPDRLHEQLTSQPNSFVYTDIISAENTQFIMFKIRGATPRIGGRALDYCQPLHDEIRGIMITQINNTTDTVQIAYYESTDTGFRLVTREPGRLDFHPDDPEADPTATTYSPVLVPERDALCDEYDDLVTWAETEYGIRPQLAIA